MQWQIGELDQRITIQRETLADDGIGGQAVTIATVAIVWAKVIARAGRERTQAGRLDAENSYTFVIRRRSDIREADRILWDGAQHNIRSVVRQGVREMYLEIEAERGTAQ